MSEISYAREKFDQAVANMAVDRGHLEGRIYSAWLTVHTVKSAAFEGDEALEEAWGDLQRMFKEAEAGTNSLERGLHKIEDRDVDRLADQIVLVAGRLRQATDES